MNGKAVFLAMAMASFSLFCFHFPSSINTNFDTNPKKWRFVSGLVMDSSCLLEACTCFYPALFLPIASLANIGKNVGWLSASATKAGIHQVSTIHDNVLCITKSTLEI